MRLKINPNKTELISFGGRAQLKKGTIGSIEVGDATVNASTIVKYLGAYLDHTLDFKKQVMMKTQTARFNLSKIRNIRKFLAETVMLGLVMSQLSKSLYNGLPAVTIPDDPKPSSQSHTKSTKNCNSCNVRATLAPNQAED